MSRRKMPYWSTDLDLWRKCNDPEKRAAKFFFRCWQFDYACDTRIPSECVSVSRSGVPKAA